MIDEAIPNNNIQRVYINTGIEYIDIVNFVKSIQENDSRIVIINSAIKINEMLEKVGYPFKSKEHSAKLGSFQKNGITKPINKYLLGIQENGETIKFVCPNILKYQFDKDFELKISDKCCDELKKKIVHKYEKQSKKNIGIVGLRMTEGGQRANKPNCVVFDRKNKLIRFKPLNPLSDEFCEWYLEKRNIKLSRLYYEPFNFKRTGCKGCPFAIDLQKQLEVMERLLPKERKQCEMIWKPVYNEYRKLGYRLDKNEQSKLF